MLVGVGSPVGDVWGFPSFDGLWKSGASVGGSVMCGGGVLLLESVAGGDLFMCSRALSSSEERGFCGVLES